MKMVRIICLVATIICSGSCSRSPQKAPVATSRFQPGQVWTFHSPTNELPGATLTVAGVDFDPKEGPIIYVMVTGVRHTTWQSTNMFYPFCENALNRSVDTLVKSNAPLSGDEFKDFQWFHEVVRQGVEKGKDGKCFKITLLEVMETKSQPPEKKPWWRFW
jgi:hypothetical protein